LPSRSPRTFPLPIWGFCPLHYLCERSIQELARSNTRSLCGERHGHYGVNLRSEYLSIGHGIAYTAAWFAHARALHTAGLAIISEADRMTVGADVRDPKVLALALLCRTLSNMNGATLMVESGLIVEARTLTRCCFENLLWIAELADKGAEFVIQMVEDEVASRQGRGKMALSWSERLEEAAPYEKGLRESLERMSAKYPKSKPIRYNELGKTQGIDNSYMWYRLLSGDAAHPSLSALSRYFIRQPNNVLELAVLPVPDTKDEEDTLQFACQATLGVCVATCQICTVPNAYQTLSLLFDEFIELAKGR
jgi:Family of unknown function (DUF5677)